MKGRFRILKLPFEFQDETHIDNVFYTCAVLHNKIQRHQKFDQVWKQSEHWLGRGGLFGNEHVGSRLYGQLVAIRIILSEVLGAGSCTPEEKI